MKKLFAVIMSMLLVVCYMPVTAFAAGDGGSDGSVDTVVAKIGTTEYTDLNEAIEAAIKVDGDATIEIVADCDIDPIEIDSDNSITIIGNDHTVTGWDKGRYDGGDYLTIDIYSKVAFNNIKFKNFSCGDEYTDVNASVIACRTGCDLTITDCSFENFNRKAIFFAPGNGANMTVEGCTFDCTPYKSAFSIQKAMEILPYPATSNVNIKDCEIYYAKSTSDSWTAGGIEIFGGTVCIDGCTLNGCDEGVLVSREYYNNILNQDDYDASSNVTLKDTTITANNAAVAINCYSGGSTRADVSIESGNYTGLITHELAEFTPGGNTDPDSNMEKCSLVISGGTFDRQPSAKYIDEGYAAIVAADGTYEVGKIGTKDTSTEGTVTTTVETFEVTDSKGNKETVTVKTSTDSTNNITTTTRVDGKTAVIESAIPSGSETLTTRNKVVTLDATAAGDDAADVKKAQITIPANTVAALKQAAADDSVESVTIKTDVATLDIDKTALQTLTDSESNDDELILVLDKTDETVSSEDSITATYELTALLNGIPVFTETNQDNGTITISVPYEAADNYKSLDVYYVLDEGEKTNMNATYSGDEALLTWETTHFSTFEVVEILNPADPVTPDNDNHSDDSNNNDNKDNDSTQDTAAEDNAADTGDDFNLMPMIALAIISGAAVMVISITNRRKQKN